jgi:hypothetical protein
VPVPPTTYGGTGTGRISVAAAFKVTSTFKVASTDRASGADRAAAFRPALARPRRADAL